VTVSSNPNPSTYGQTVTFTATVTAKPGAGTPSGNVTFWDGPVGTGTNLGTRGLNTSGVATLPVSILVAGPHTINVVYAGSTTYAPSNSSMTQTVNKAAVVVTLSSSSPNGSVYGQNVTITATATA